MTFKKWMVGATLAGIMVGALGANGLLFSARSFQHELLNLAPESMGVIELAKFDQIESQISQVKAAAPEEREEAATSDAEVSALQQKFDALVAGAEKARVELAVGIQDLEQKLDVVADFGMTDSDGLEARLAALAAQRRAAAADKQQIEHLKDSVQSLRDVERDVSEAGISLDAAKQRRRAAGEQVAGVNRQINTLKAEAVPGGYEHYDAIRQAVLGVKAASPFGWGAALIQMHPQFLSMALVLLMGALGGVLYLFPAYMSRENPVTFAEIFVRMIFGMCTALAFYIVVNASVAGLSFMPQNGGMAGAASLNPFSVSLIGIVAGIMADDIARWIRSRGSDLLGGAPSGEASGLAQSSDGGGAMGVKGDPFRAAAQDAYQSRIGGKADSDDPPRGGVVR